MSGNNVLHMLIKNASQADLNMFYVMLDSAWLD